MRRYEKRALLQKVIHTMAQTDVQWCRRAEAELPKLVVPRSSGDGLIKPLLASGGLSLSMSLEASAE